MCTATPFHVSVGVDLGKPLGEGMGQRPGVVVVEGDVGAEGPPIRHPCLNV